MFVIQSDLQSVGSLGYRLGAGEIDVYNVILARRDLGRQGLMGNALRIACSHAKAKYNLPIVAKVLCSNPAARWYERNSFRLTPHGKGYLRYELDESVFLPCDVQEHGY